MLMTEQRKKRGWSQSKLARVAEMNASTICAIENHRHNPWPGQVAKIAAVLEWPPECAAELFQEAAQVDQP